MNKPTPESELPELRSRVREMRGRGVPAHDIALRLGAEFHICVYSARNKVIASFVTPRGQETFVTLA